MTMADVWATVWIIAAILVVINCYWLLAGALFPRMLAATSHSYSVRPIRIFLTGLFIGVPMTVVGLILLKGNAPPVKLAGFALLLFALLFGLLGSAGLANRVGLGLPSSPEPIDFWRARMRGGVVLAFTFVLPFLGWFVILPLTLITGFGALIDYVFLRRRVKPAHQESQVEEAAA